MHELQKATRSKNIMMKLGEEGLMIHSISNTSDEYFTDQIEALNKNPKDVAGAGDSMLICASLSLSCGATISEAAYIGSIAAAIQIGRIGNTPIKIHEIMREINL
jgi:bifunctional ADP-heptose synthase (sugar kinase/adenylyltransferase)